MRYTQITEPQTRDMLGAIGVSSMDDLFAPVPPKFRLRRDLNIPRGLSESEMMADLRSLAIKNHGVEDLVCFAGAGAYDHFIPTVVDALAAQSEFLTAYTPYQAEASQGTLQMFYEFQTMVCQLTGMDVANASLYEFASAAAEAMLMAVSITDRRKVVVADSAHPDLRGVLRTYASQRGIEIAEIPATEGVLDARSLAGRIDETTAAVVLQYPNVHGCVERLDQLIPVIHERGALAIVSVDPIACGMLKSPGALGADIVVGDGQPLGIPLQYGGPYLGLLACREKYLRKMPGRIVGMTQDADGRRGFCLTLQTREQHIKRERATSNICTNQGLLAVRASIYLAAMGKKGVTDVANQCFDKAHYAASRIAALKGYELRFRAPFFKEFTVRSAKPVRRVLEACRQRGIIGGVPMESFDAALKDCFLVAVTEKRTREEIDSLVAALESA